MSSSTWMANGAVCACHTGYIHWTAYEQELRVSLVMIITSVSSLSFDIPPVWEVSAA